jgi:hypothetical protein
MEIALIRILLRKGANSLEEIDRKMCEVFPGLLTPPLDLLDSILHSYGVQDKNGWAMKADDQPRARSSDLREIKNHLRTIGQKLNYQIKGENEIIWLNDKGQAEFQFHVIASGIVQATLSSFTGKSDTKKFIVLPGSRSHLLLTKIARDPRLAKLIDQSWTFLKFRHLRRLAENETINRASFQDLLYLDPLNEDQVQAPLL